MYTNATTLAQLAAHRRLDFAPDGALQMIWDNASVRIPVYELAHLAAALDRYFAKVDPACLRHGYYRVAEDPAGGVQLWLNATGISLSYGDLRALAALVTQALDALQPACPPRGAAFAREYRLLDPVLPRRFGGN